MTKKPKKDSSKRRSANSPKVPSQGKKLAPGDPSDQDVKRRLGHFQGAGEPHISLKGTRGKNHKPSK